MSDLISRSPLLKEIETWGGCVETLHEYIQNMPTAYDIDKVVEELEESRITAGGLKLELIPCERAIQIVKQGGVADDVCEWKLTKPRTFMPYKTSCGNDDLYDSHYKYCPYCSKKIKVVE